MKLNGSQVDDGLILPDSIPEKKKLTIELESGEWQFLTDYQKNVGVTPELFISRATQRLINDKTFQSKLQKRIDEAK